jgi:hypothetical protein
MIFKILAKGQLISKEHFGVFKSTKIPALHLKRGQIEKIRSLYTTN